MLYNRKYNDVWPSNFGAAGHLKMDKNRIVADLKVSPAIRQQDKTSLGLYFYNARWYDPALARFIQPDTVVPGAGNPLAWDRYAYVNDNPLRYSDPSGHAAACGVADECGGSGGDKPETEKPPVITLSKENGLCIKKLGCSGGESYRRWWREWYLPRMDDYLIEDMAKISQFLVDPLDLGLDAYENWKGIPLPKKYGFGIDFVTQLIIDGPRDDLSIFQRAVRAGLNGTEGIFTSGASTAVGLLVGDAALAVSFVPVVSSDNLWLPPVAYWAGYASSYMAVNYTVGSGFDYLNAQIFYPLFNLGSP